MKNNNLIKALKNGISDINEGYTDEAHFLFNKQTIEIIIESLERSYNKDCAVTSPAETSPKPDKSGFAQS